MAIVSLLALVACGSSATIQRGDAGSKAPSDSLPTMPSSSDATTEGTTSSTPINETATTLDLGLDQVNPMPDAIVVLDTDHIVWLDEIRDSYRVFVSSDAGASWTATLQFHRDQSAAVVGSGRVVWIAAVSEAWSSTDSGMTWHQRTTPHGGLALLRLTADGVAVGLTPRGELVRETADGGWSSVSQREPFHDVCTTDAGSYVGASKSGLSRTVDPMVWATTLPAPLTPIDSMICTPTRIVAMAGGVHMGSSSTRAWVSRDGGATWTDATSTPFDAWANDPVNHTSFYAPVAAPSDGSTWYHGYWIMEAMNASFNFEVSPDDGKTSVPVVLNVQKPTGIDYIVGPISVTALNAHTLWVVLDRSGQKELTQVLEVTYDQGHTWREITPPE